MDWLLVHGRGCDAAGFQNAVDLLLLHCPRRERPTGVSVLNDSIEFHWMFVDKQLINDRQINRNPYPMNIENYIPHKKAILARKKSAHPVSYPRTLTSAK
jgi:ATP-dependent exoDNAse (exonuclease V) alpha subunit